VLAIVYDLTLQLPVRNGVLDMQDRDVANGGALGSGAYANVKSPWHAPLLKRLDVDLTAGSPRTSNEPPTGRNQFSGAPS